MRGPCFGHTHRLRSRPKITILGAALTLSASSLEVFQSEHRPHGIARTQLFLWKQNPDPGGIAALPRDGNAETLVEMPNRRIYIQAEMETRDPRILKLCRRFANF